MYDFDRRPVENVSWWDALKFCNRLSEKYGLKPVYDLSQSNEGILKINQLNGKTEFPNKADFKKTEGFRLPTEVEWEWFARGGEVAIQDGTFDYEYSGSDDIDEVAWHSDNSDGHTHDVGIKKPNQLGLYDCCGNVFEWCYDTNTYGYISKKIPYVYDASDIERRMRGGTWYVKDKEFIRISCRAKYTAVGDRYEDEIDNSFWYGINVCKGSVLGFRIVRTV